MAERELEDIETLLRLARQDVRHLSVVGYDTWVDVVNELEKRFMQLQSARSVIAQQTEEIESLRTELNNMTMLYNAASATTLAANDALTTAEHKVEALREIVHPLVADDPTPYRDQSGEI